jgi:ComF family protein
LLAPFAYVFPIDAVVQALKYGGRLTLSRPLADALAATIDERVDLLIPMPLSEARLRERGFNQSHEIARPVSRITGIDLAADLCRRVVHTPPQAMLPWKERARNVRGAFVCDTDLSGLHVAVIDDVVTTGATLNEIARVLKRAGASRVSGWSAARALRHAVTPGTAS